jgi:hypothetical protein
MNLAISRDADRTFREQVCRPEQRRVEKKLKGLFKEFTSDFIFKFLETDVIDAEIKSKIHDRYARIQVYSPNDILRDLGKPTRKDGDTVLPFGPQLKPQFGAAGGAGTSGQSQQKTGDTTKPNVPADTVASGTQKEKGEAQDTGTAKPKSQKQQQGG